MIFSFFSVFPSKNLYHQLFNITLNIYDYGTIVINKASKNISGYAQSDTTLVSRIDGSKNGAGQSRDYYKIA